MPQSPDARHLFDAAGQAAAAGDFDAAYELLGSAARVQEAALGPLHPDLASTLNNLAIVAEKKGRTGDAETFYRRAAAIAAASLPPDHPMVRDSRQNLEEFCRAAGLRVDPPAAAPAPAAEKPAPVVVPAAGAVTTEAAARAVEPAASSQPMPRPATPPARSTSTPAVPPEPSPAPHAASASRPLAWVAIAAVVLVAAALAVTRPWSSREPASATTAAAPAPVDTPPPAVAPEPADTSPPPSPAPPVAPAATQAPPRSAPPDTPRDDAARAEPDRTPASVAVTLDTADLCSTFSTAGAWRCEPAGDSVAPGSIVLYTRVKSSRDTVIVHRWYRGGALRQSVRLTIRANPAAGYRTYSRQTVDAGADWRVEVRSANGDLLHERRFSVR